MNKFKSDKKKSSSIRSNMILCKKKEKVNVIFAIVVAIRFNILCLTFPIVIAINYFVLLSKIFLNR